MSYGTSRRPITSMVILFGVRVRNTKPKFRAAETSAASSGLCAWYSSLPSTVSAMTVWQRASRRKKLWACSSSDRTASNSVRSYQRKSLSWCGLAEKSIGSRICEWNRNQKRYCTIEISHGRSLIVWMFTIEFRLFCSVWICLFFLVLSLRLSWAWR